MKIRRTVGALAQSACLLLQTAFAAPLPYQSHDRHLGVASCSSSVCHGSIKPTTHGPVRLDEYVTWSHQDAHAKAFQALTGEPGRSIAAKLGLAAADSAKICLDCHSDNVAAAERGPKFTLTDGVACEACHGGAERWIASHASGKATYREDVDHGMYPSANLLERAALCESCHVGSNDKLATHAVMGAGHPRLGFELDTYLALQPPHYSIDAGYRRRKPTFNHAQTWAVGQLQASLLQLDLLQSASLRAGGVFPELALFNCTACHDSSTQRPQWRRRAMTQSTNPGTVPLNDAYWRMSWVIARALDPQEGLRVLALSQALQHAAMVSREQIAARAHDLADALKPLEQRAVADSWSTARASSVLGSVLQAGLDGEYRDYLGAEQAVMAMELLLIDTGQAVRLRTELDALYKEVKDVDSYHSSDFIAALKSLRAAM